MDLMRRMDPEVRECFKDLPEVSLDDIDFARSLHVAMRTTTKGAVARQATVVTEDLRVPGVGCQPDVMIRHYCPATQSQPLPCLYWMHGGGYVLGSVEDDDPVVDQIVAAVNCAVVSVEWRKAPENPFPAPMIDCYVGLKWTYEHAQSLRIDPSHLAIGGSSSGAGLAAGLALLARDTSEVPICFQLLVYPMLDDRCLTASSYRITDPRVWNRESNLKGWRAYLGDAAGTDAVSPYAAPARATCLDGLPPAYISVGDLDLFLDENIEYARRLLQAGVPTELHVYAGGVHGFDRFAPAARLSQRFIRDRHEVLLGVFGI